MLISSLLPMVLLSFLNYRIYRTIRDRVRARQKLNKRQVERQRFSLLFNCSVIITRDVT